MEYLRKKLGNRAPAIALILLAQCVANAGERFESQEVAASSQRLLECLKSPVQWKTEVTNRLVVDFSLAYAQSTLPKVCLQYVSCTDQAKAQKFSQLLECEMLPSGSCEDIQVCAEQRAAGNRPFYLADIRAVEGPSSYVAEDTTSCTQVGSPEALHAAPERAVCVQKMDCGKPDAPKNRIVFACPVTGQAVRPDHIEDGPIQECPAFHACVRTALQLKTFSPRAAPKIAATPSTTKASTTKSSTKAKPADDTPKPARKASAAPQKTAKKATAARPAVRKPANKPPANKPPAKSAAKPTTTKKTLRR